MLFLSWALLSYAATSAATTLCDVVTQHNASAFCDAVNSINEIRTGFSRVSNVTVLAFRNATSFQSLSFQDDRAALMKYHFIRGIYSLQDVMNSTIKSDPAVQCVHLDTFLDDNRYANITQGQKMLALIPEQNDESTSIIFSTSSQLRTTVEADLPFDGGLVHIIREPLQNPQPLSAILGPAASSSHANFTIWEQAVNLTGLDQELNAARDAIVLVPSNSAFHQVGSMFDGLSIDRLKEILRYHVIVGNLTYGSTIPPGSASWSRQVTSLMGKPINMTHIAEDGKIRKELLFNQGSANSPDYLLENGNMLHFDTLLDPDHPSGSTYPGSKLIPSDQPLFTNIVRPSSTSTATTSPTGSPSSSPQPHHDRLSKGAKAGIGVGVPVAVLSLSSLPWILLLRRKRLLSGEKAAQSGPESASDIANGAHNAGWGSEVTSAPNAPAPLDLPEYVSSNNRR